MTRLHLSTAQQAAARARASESAGRSSQAGRYRIEGETLTAAEIGERLGCAKNTALNKLRAARGLAGPITWARLREISS